MPYAAGSTGDFVKYGPGVLYVAPLGTTEPTDLSTAWNAAFVKVGFTDGGHTFTYTPSYEDIEVAETLLPIAKVPTGQQMQVEFALAEITAENLQRALNGATLTASGTGATAIQAVEPLAFGATETRVMIGWQADDASERWVYRRCLQTGAVAINRQKGANKATIACTFSLEPVSSTVRPFKAIVRNTSVVS